jgi:type IV secretion system protein VirB2
MTKRIVHADARHFSLSQAALCGGLASLLCLILVSGAAAASPYDSPMGFVLCSVAKWIIYGNLGRGLATLAIVVVGVGATLGKVSWGLAITVAVGISVVFGAPQIVSALMGSSISVCV